MIILGIILLVIGLLIGSGALVTVGVVVAIVGALLGLTGHLYY